MADPKAVRRYLDQVIAELDAGRAPRRARASAWVRALSVPAAVGLAVGLSSCPSSEPREVDKADVEAAVHAGTLSDICDLIDAAPGCDPCAELGFYGDGECDEFCPADDPDCATILYGVPTFEGDCSDGLDDDGDGLVDCCDDDCEGDSACAVACPEYGAPMPERDCGDCIDNDCDGLVDDLDPDCTGELYGAPPFEADCSDGLDDDGDGLVDCCDDDCEGSADCVPACPRYMAPLSELECGDCIDDDCDGLVDGDDPDCMGTLYAAPF